MRNLKRVLSLGLASVMLIGMMVMGAGAADKKASDLTDMDKVQNKNEVALLVDLGIVQGTDKGEYNPTGVVDRATMAKFVTYIMMGDVDQSSFAGTSTPLKDVAGNWAEGYIKYCYSNGIISGDNNNNFTPSGQVTTVAAYKMLLVALGYDAEGMGYQNDPSWSTNIVRDATKAGLTKGISSKANEGLTRDDAAKVIYNALFAKTVTNEYGRDNGDKYITKTVENATTLGEETYGLKKIVATVSGIDKDGVLTMTATGANKIAINAANKAKFTGNADMVGSSVTFYTKNDVSVDGKTVSYTFKSLYSSAVVAGGSEILGTSTDGTAISKLIDSKDKKFIAAEEKNDDSEVTTTYYLNGVSKDMTKADEAKAVNDSVAKKGTVVEFVDLNNNGDVDVIRVIEKKVATLSSDPKTKTDSDGNITVSITNVTGGKYAIVNGYEGLKKDDVVLYYSSNDVYYVEKAESVEGVVSTVSSAGKLTIDGTGYEVSGLTGATPKLDDAKKWDDTDNTYTWYLDNGGYIVSYVQETNETSATNFAVILDAAWVDGVGGLSSSKYMEIKVLFTDGTTEVVTATKLDGDKIVKSGAGDDEADSADVIALKGKFVNFGTDKDGKYLLTTVTEKDPKATQVAMGTGTIDPSKASFAKDADGNAVSGNSKTVILVAKGKDDKTTYTTYTGTSTLPKITPASGSAVVKGGLATYVYLATDKVSTEDASTLFLIDPTTYSRGKDADGNVFYGYAAIHNGDKITLKLDGILNTDNVKSGLFTTNAVLTDIIAKGDISSVGAKFATEVKTVSGGTLVLGAGLDAGTVFSYDEDTRAYIINPDYDDASKYDDADVSDVSPEAIDTDATYTAITVKADDNGYISAIYLVVADT